MKGSENPSDMMTKVLDTRNFKRYRELLGFVAGEGILSVSRLPAQMMSETPESEELAALMGATHFKEMMIPLFVMMRKNFVVTKLGWAVVSVTCFSPYAKISTKNKRENLSILN